MTEMIQADGAVIVRPRASGRIALVVLGLGFGGWMAWTATIDDPWLVLFVGVGVALALDGVRTRVLIDSPRRVVVVTRAFRRIEVPLDDIVDVEVGRRRRIYLVARPGSADSSLSHGSIRLFTGLFARAPSGWVTHGEEPMGAHDLLARHLGVSVVSASPRYRTIDRELLDRNPQTNFRTLRTREGVVTWVLTAGLAVLSVAIVMTAVSLVV